MNQWINRSHPQTLQAGVILGYISAVFGMLGVGTLVFLPVFLGLGVGAFVTANNRRWGYFVLAICACLAAGLRLLVLALSLTAGIVPALFALNQTVFPTALAAAVLHVQSREYQKIWFE